MSPRSKPHKKPNTSTLTHRFITINLEKGVNSLNATQLFMHINAADQIADALVQLTKQFGQLLSRNLSDFCLEKRGEGLRALGTDQLIAAFDVGKGAVGDVRKSYRRGHTHHIKRLNSAQACAHSE